MLARQDLHHLVYAPASLYTILWEFPKLGTVAHTYDPSTEETEPERSWARKVCVYNKTEKNKNFLEIQA
jgi:hypothetical protein